MTIACTECARDNPDASSFCGYCGKRLGRFCSNCSSEVAAQFRFCGQCGTEVSAPPHAELTQTEIVAPEITPRAGRRQVTILFADLVGSTQLSRRLDPEDLRDLIARYRTIAAEAVGSFSGEVSRYIGDGIVAFFGFPVAHENDAGAAVHAGLALVDAMKQDGDQFSALFGVAPQVRVGIHTGVVVAGDLQSGSVFERMSVVGETPNIAARIQEAALPDTVVIGPTTARLVPRHVELRSLGARSLKGVEVELELFEAIQHPQRRHRLRNRDIETTSLEGREEEVRALGEMWRSTCAGVGCTAVIEGEAGIGKSRLLREVARVVAPAETGPRWMDWAGSPFTRNTPFAPVIDALWRALPPANSESDPLDALHQLLAGVQHMVPEAIELVAELLELPWRGTPSTVDWSPARRRHRLLEALTAWLTHGHLEQPGILAVEDLHWMDASTRELVTLVSLRVPSVALFLLVTTRPDHRMEILDEPDVHVLRLHPLARRNIDLIVQSMAPARVLSLEIVEAIAQKSDGVPLFAEELTRSLLERWTSSAVGHEVSVPDTLRDALMERLDRLPQARSRIEAAAVLGRTFTFRDLVGIADCDEGALAETLEAVAVAGILIPNGFPPDANYTFKHSLIRDAAYESLLHRTRSELHRKAAERSANDPNTTWPPEQIAHHFAEAGESRRAFEFSMKAAEEAHRSMALSEAIAGFAAARAQLLREPPSVERDDLELEAQIKSGAVLLAARGYGSEDVRSAYEGASTLARKCARLDASFASLWGLSSYYTVAGPADRAAEIGDLTIATALRMSDPFVLAEAQRRRGLIAFTQGEFPTADRYYRAATEHLAEAPNPDGLLFGTRPSSLLANNVAWLAWYMGEDSPLAKARYAIDHARGLKDSYALAFALGVGAAVAQHSGEPETTRELADECARLSEKQLFRYWQAWANVFSGWAAVQLGDHAGLKLIVAARQAYLATGANQLNICALTLLAEAHLHRGEPELASRVLRDVDPTRDGAGLYFMSEFLRLRAATSHALGDHDRAVQEIQEAIAVATAQGAPALIERATKWHHNALGRRPRQDG